MVCWALFTVLLREWPSIYPTLFAIETTGGVLYLTTFATIVVYLFYNRAAEIAGANKAGQVVFISPIKGSIIAIVILKQKFNFYHAVGFPLVYCLGFILDITEENLTKLVSITLLNIPNIKLLKCIA